MTKFRCLKATDHMFSGVRIYHNIRKHLNTCDFSIICSKYVPQRRPYPIICNHSFILITSIYLRCIQIVFHSFKIRYFRQVPIIQQICSVKKTSSCITDCIFLQLRNPIQPTIPFQICQIISPIILKMCKQLRHYSPILI